MTFDLEAEVLRATEEWKLAHPNVSFRVCPFNEMPCGFKCDPLECRLKDYAAGQDAKPLGAEVNLPVAAAPLLDSTCGYLKECE